MWVSVDRTSSDQRFTLPSCSHVHACVYSSNDIFMAKKFKLTAICVTSGFCHGVNEVFALLGCYEALIGSYRYFGAAYRPHLFGLLDSKRWDP
jgi:hypothetical protein